MYRYIFSEEQLQLSLERRLRKNNSEFVKTKSSNIFVQYLQEFKSYGLRDLLLSEINIKLSDDFLFHTNNHIKKIPNKEILFQSTTKDMDVFSQNDLKNQKIIYLIKFKHIQILI